MPSLGGALRRLAPRRRHLHNETPVPSKAQFGSTATLTEAGGSADIVDGDEGSENSSTGGYCYDNGNGANGAENASIASDADFNSDSEFLVVYIFTCSTWLLIFCSNALL